MQDTLDEPPSKRQRITQTDYSKIPINCEWNLCTASINEINSFLFHVADHVKAIEDLPVGNYLCFWRECGFTCPERSEMERHVYFHAFHAKIKAAGSLFLEMKNLKCENDSESINIIPEIPMPFQCQWTNCNISFVSAQNFFWHVHGHALTVDRSPTDQRRHCGWQGCRAKTKATLMEHIRSHTQEKLFGCPKCGALFTCSTKLVDHCLRRKTTQDPQYKCIHCMKCYPTERLLKEHVRAHVNNFKCQLCEMTCTSNNTLNNHMKYRHSNERPFPCPKCDHKCKTQNDLIKHFTIHEGESGFLCPVNDCKFVCKGQGTLLHHVHNTHNMGRGKKFKCHICDYTAQKGVNLTNHLKRKHDYHWPSGHTRFRYMIDKDGFYKLQTTRIERLELAESILRETTDPNGNEALLELNGQSYEPSNEMSNVVYHEDSSNLTADSPTEDPLFISNEDQDCSISAADCNEEDTLHSPNLQAL